jgi:magnesium chelatase family protein
MNPCPCGYLGHAEKGCRCQAASIEHYRARISGPLLDRIDALIEVPSLTLSMFDQNLAPERSAPVKQRVADARGFRRERLLARPAVSAHPLENHSLLTTEARRLLRQALVKDSLSGRGYVRIISLARTIADLDNVLPVAPEHVAEALALRLDHRRIGFS